MALWQCGICNATYSSADDLNEHHDARHGTRPRPAEPMRPASARVKTLTGDEPDASTIRSKRPFAPTPDPGEGSGGHDDNHPIRRPPRELR
ncbi:MAG TPA: hypothetical protein VM889_14985 [Candidatus Thermoplasmatota archaeon]|nr:hypothetical protein [Candidatus Thermoplasmatota archaeon]